MMSIFFWLAQVLCLGTTFAQPVGRWGLFGAHLRCPDTTSCTYSFLIDERVKENTSIDGKWCQFSVTGSGGQPASNASFANASCTGLSQYRINGGWDPHGFVTIAVTNLDKGQYAFFSYETAEIEEGSTRYMNEQPSYIIGTFSRRSASSIGPTEDNAQVREKEDEAWTVQGLVRRIHSTKLYLEFDIITPMLEHHCFILVEESTNVNAGKASWSDQTCKGSKWFISWAFDASTGAAYMTVKNPIKAKKARFGWEHINSSEYFATAGPIPVEAV